VSDTSLVVKSLLGKYKRVLISTNAVLKVRGASWYELSANVSADGHEALRLQGSLNRDAISANLTLKEFNLAYIMRLVPEVDALGGIATAEIKVTGTKSTPSFSGQLEILKLLFSPSLIPDTLKNGSLNLSFDNKMVGISKFDGDLGGGTVAASGKYFFDKNSKSSELTIQVRDVQVIHTRDYVLTLKKADISVSRPGKLILVDGDVVLGNSRLLYNFTPQMLIAMLKTSNQPKPEQSDLMRSVRLDIRVRNSDNLWIDNNLARIKLKADIALVGTISNQPYPDG